MSRRATIREGHELTLDPNKIAGTCKCGEAFTSPKTYPDVAKAWQGHVDGLTLIAKAQEAVRREHAARAEGEQAIVALLTSGVPARKVSAAIGSEGDTLLMSPTTVLRIGRTHGVAANGGASTNEQTPRRRRK